MAKGAMSESVCLGPTLLTWSLSLFHKQFRGFPAWPPAQPHLSAQLSSSVPWGKPESSHHHGDGRAPPPLPFLGIQSLSESAEFPR